MKYTKASLIQQYEAGDKLKFLHFWGHRPHPSGQVSSSCFSQWWEATFEVNGQAFPTAEHWMMAEKARLFGDEAIYWKILKSASPGEAKKFGREVRRFDQETWEQHRFDIVVQGNLHKFQQHWDLQAYLLGSGNRILVEASPVDPIWGIGMAANHESANVPPKWQGLNLLGFALMEVRNQLMG